MTKVMDSVDLIKQLNEKESHIKCLDVRRDDEVAQGMIPGAFHIVLSDLPDQYTSLDPQVNWVVYCKKGGRSARACEFLESKGYRVINLTGGYDAYTVQCA
jgi:rhodanese-related sulfurtransferase